MSWMMSVLVENYAKKNHSHFPIAVHLITLICNCQRTTNYYFLFATKILGMWGLVINHWKRLESTFPTVHYTPPKNYNFNHKTR